MVLNTARRRELRETVYLDRINPIHLNVDEWSSEDDAWTALDLTLGASFELQLVPADGNSADPLGPFSTDDYADAVDASTAGLVILVLGALPLTVGTWWLRLAVVDLGGNRTQVAHESSLQMRVLVEVVGGEE